jgi:ubiquinol-cytochrome c reductase iron-sulfur subunit
VLVVVGICTHLGCSPSDKFQPGPQPSLPDDWQGRLLLPLPWLHLRHGRPRVQEQAGARQPEVPPHMYLSDSRLLIGEDKKGLNLRTRHGAHG